MLSLSSSAEILLYREPTDMRKSFDGLAGIVREQLGREPTDGSIFLFLNRRQDRLKLLYWDRDGLALWYKRLEAGSFERIQRGDQAAICIDATELSMLLGGVSLGDVKRRKRYQAVA
ncbi:MAG TPA: IS66 family insertion sequence element accessory protein TnpB [Pirellulales bacterium]|jgi:transposase|nr:IS66 family insertion sequence element accessory protein TnpB [Pirellulales bacterium]